jgi:hypothetical protein
VDLRRLHVYEWIAGAGGALLLLSLFLPWFTGGTATIFGLGPARLDDGFSAWKTFTVADGLFAAGALAAIALPLAAVARRATAGPPLPVLVALTGLALALLILARLLSPPEFQLVQEGRSAISVITFRGSDPAVGLWLGLAACAAIFAGGCLTLRGIALVAAPARQARR